MKFSIDKLLRKYLFEFRTKNTSFYYLIKPLIPRSVQLYIRSSFVKYIKVQFEDIWPINESSSKPRETFSGWPEKKDFAVVLTHDVDTGKGQKKCMNLASVEERMGFRSSFNFVPERYRVDPKLRKQLIERDFEVGVHGLNHDGKLYKNHDIFISRAKKINAYLKEWEAVGFRSPSMHHNLEWIHELDIEYDSSCFDTDPFEPQPDGVGTIFPFWVHNSKYQRGYVELPYTLPQDFTLFILMNQKNIDIWKEKLDWIAENGGMALIGTHPDFMHFGEGRKEREEYPAQYYEEFLKYIKEAYEGMYWHVLPRDMAKYWLAEREKRTKE